MVSLLDVWRINACRRAFFDHLFEFADIRVVQCRHAELIEELQRP
jgi:hypothetical protein